MVVDDLVQNISYYNHRNILFHGYLAPFFIIHALVYYSYRNTLLSNQPVASNISNSISPTDSNDTDTSKAVDATIDDKQFQENWVIIVILCLAAQALTFLFCHWSVKVKCWLTYKRCTNPFEASYARVDPTPNNGSSELVPIIKETISNQSRLWFLFQKTKYFHNPKIEQFSVADFPLKKPLSFYKNWKGYQDPNEIHTIERLYGNNELEMVIPKFKELFTERATAPFFVFQVFCVSLWCLDEYWYYALFTLFMLVTFEVVLVKHQLRNMQEIRKMGNKPHNVQVFRQNKWKPIKSNQLVPGDLINVTRSEHNVPCDILILKGSCIVDESTLTGESIPQMKESIEDIDDDDREFDLNQDKLYILFGGTKVLQTSTTKELGCMGYVLKTGFNTSQGKLLRTILFGVKRVTANNFETFIFIVFLLFFAVISASYVWFKGIQDPTKSRYRLFFECTIIITSVVPPELPIELSLAVNASLISLVKLFIYCTEPFRIPFAGKVEYCCFDKTGTLTGDDLVVEGLAGVIPTNSKGDTQDADTCSEQNRLCRKSEDLSSLANSGKVVKIKDCPLESLQILATCNSITYLDDKLVGDPLEKKVLEAIEWNYSKSGTVAPKRGRSSPLRIHKRFHFNSTLKRMSAIAGYKIDMSSESTYFVVAKGAPEYMKPLLANVPENYDDLYLEMSTLGARVLTLARKDLGPLSHQELNELRREDVESKLEFAGFLLISTLLKPDSKETCLELMKSSHRLVMITGDGALTACHIARMLHFVRSEVLILGPKDGQMYWQSTPPKIEESFVNGFNMAKERNIDMCLTGESLDFVLKQKEINPYDLIKRVKVFARVSPKQKELVITTLKSNGHSVLMCGDGTNDVGALKHADVGVALLTTSQSPEAAATSERIHQDMKAIIAKLQQSPTAPDPRLPSNSNKKPNPSGKQSKKPQSVNLNPAEERKKEIMAAQQKFRELLEEESQVQIVKLGDASIAAPFTSRLSSIQCICHIVKQGRCTLVTTLQMFKILALNALISAYCHSVLYIDGIKFSDSQITLQGLLCTLCFLFITRSQPLKKLSARRPLPNIFNTYTVLTVLLQFAVHLSSLLYIYEYAKSLPDPNLNSTITDTSPSTTTMPITESNFSNQTSSDKTSEFHTEFRPSIVNSTIFIISISLQVATFIVNYKGHPFMQDLRSNKPLCYTFVASALLVFVCIKGNMTDLMDQLSVVEFPTDYQHILLLVVCLDFGLAYCLDRICEYLFGRNFLKPL